MILKTNLESFIVYFIFSILFLQFYFRISDIWETSVKAQLELRKFSYKEPQKKWLMANGLWDV